jgi:hypothetical protein
MYSIRLASTSDRLKDVHDVIRATSKERKHDKHTHAFVGKFRYLHVDVSLVTAIMQGSVGQCRQTQIELITKVAWFSEVYSGNSDLVRARSACADVVRMQWQRR